MKNKLLKFLSLALIFINVGCGQFVIGTSNSEGGNSSIEESSIVEESSVDNKSYWSEVYCNPVNVTYSSGSAYKNEVADPSIVKGDNGYFYCVSTDRVMLRSEDACNWEVVTTSIIDSPTWGKDYTDANYNLWAPDLIKIGDQWIYYYSLSGWSNPIGIGYATADNIEGPYTDQGKLFTGSEIGIQNCIDPQPFIDVDGTVYMTVGSFQGLYLIELTEDGTECAGGVDFQKQNKTLIAGYDGGWDGATYEGGYIMYKDGYYYYFGSAGTCCEGQSSTYRVYVGRSQSVDGPYVGKNNFPLTLSGHGTTHGELCLWAGSGADRDVIGPGHNSILVDDAGDWWMYYHAYSSLDTFGTRHLFMDKILWDEDGYPYVETYKPSFQEDLDGPRFEE